MSDELLVELVHLEIELMWELGVATAAAPVQASPSVVAQSYLKRFPQLRSDDFLPDVINSEFRARQLFGDRPSLEKFLADSPVDVGLRQHLQAWLTSTTDGKVLLKIGSRIEGEIALPAQLEIGRQRAGEPPPVEFIEGTWPRWIVASEHDQEISTMQMRIEVVALDRISISNLSRRIEIQLGDQRTAIPARRGARVNLGTSIHVGGISLLFAKAH